MRAPLWMLIVGLAACGSYHAQSGGADLHGDTFSVPTGRPGELYVVDTLRGICFFHTMVEWRGVLTQVDCADIPEARPYLADPEGGQAVADTGAYSDAEWRAFPEAWLEATCLRLEGEALDLGQLLARHELDAMRYNAMLDLAARDAAYWDDLNAEARRRCATTTPAQP